MLSTPQESILIPWGTVGHLLRMHSQARSLYRTHVFVCTWQHSSHRKCVFACTWQLSSHRAHVFAYTWQHSWRRWDLGVPLWRLAEDGDCPATQSRDADGKMLVFRDSLSQVLHNHPLQIFRKSIYSQNVSLLSRVDDSMTISSQLLPWMLEVSEEGLKEKRPRTK